MSASTTLTTSANSATLTNSATASVVATPNDPATAPSPVPLDEVERAFWLSFVRAMIVVPRALDTELIATQQLSMTEYTVLMHLSEASERQLRMSELAHRCDLSLSGMTRIVARLMADGLVERVRCADDARGAFAVLTDAGMTRLEGAYPDHLASVRRHVIDHLGGADLPALTAMLNSFASDMTDAGFGPECHRNAPECTEMH